MTERIKQMKWPAYSRNLRQQIMYVILLNKLQFPPKQPKYGKRDCCEFYIRTLCGYKRFKVYSYRQRQVEQNCYHKQISDERKNSPNDVASIFPKPKAIDHVWNLGYSWINCSFNPKQPTNGKRHCYEFYICILCGCKNAITRNVKVAATFG